MLGRMESRPAAAQDLADLSRTETAGTPTVKLVLVDVARQPQTIRSVGPGQRRYETLRPRRRSPQRRYISKRCLYQR
jgi:hypothetical protein